MKNLIKNKKLYLITIFTVVLILFSLHVASFCNSHKIIILHNNNNTNNISYTKEKPSFSKVTFFKIKKPANRIYINRKNNMRFIYSFNNKSFNNIRIYKAPERTRTIKRFILRKPVFNKVIIIPENRRYQDRNPVRRPRKQIKVNSAGGYQI